MVHIFVINERSEETTFYSSRNQMWGDHSLRPPLKFQGGLPFHYFLRRGPYTVVELHVISTRVGRPQRTDLFWNFEVDTLFITILVGVRTLWSTHIWFLPEQRVVSSLRSSPANMCSIIFVPPCTLIWVIKWRTLSVMIYHFFAHLVPLFFIQPQPQLKSHRASKNAEVAEIQFFTRGDLCSAFWTYWVFFFCVHTAA